MQPTAARSARVRVEETLKWPHFLRLCSTVFLTLITFLGSGRGFPIEGRGHYLGASVNFFVSPTPDL